MLKYAVDVVYNKDRVKDSGEPFFKFRIIINAVQMHDTGVQNMINQHRDTIRTLEQSIGSSEQYLNEKYSTEDSGSKKREREPDGHGDGDEDNVQKMAKVKELEEKVTNLKAKVEEWKGTATGILNDWNHMNEEACYGWNKDYGHLIKKYWTESESEPSNEEDDSSSDEEECEAEELGACDCEDCIEKIIRNCNTLLDNGWLVSVANNGAGGYGFDVHPQSYLETLIENYELTSEDGSRGFNDGSDDIDGDWMGSWIIVTKKMSQDQIEKLVKCVVRSAWTPHDNNDQMVTEWKKWFWLLE